MKCSVWLNRIHKSSPYNCSGYIPVIETKNMEDVLEADIVQEMIKKTYGKKFILQIDNDESTEFLEYEIEKSKAIV